MIGRAEVGCRTGAGDAALAGPAGFRTCPSRQKIDNLFSEILKNNGKGIAQQIESKEEMFLAERGGFEPPIEVLAPITV